MLKMKKLVAVLLAIMMCMGMTACGSSEAASTGVYLSENDLSYSNFLPNYNYFSSTITTQTLETFEDNTYCLTVNKVSFSNISMGPDVATGEETWNDRGQTTEKYYGTFTEESDEENRVITLAKPTKMEYGKFGAPYMNSESVTEDVMIEQLGGDPVSATEYLNGLMEKFPEDAVVMVSISAGTFEQVSFETK